MVKNKNTSHPDNPFGKWTTYRAQIAALSRQDARNPAAELEARQMLKAARLADRILADREELTDDERTRLAAMIRGEA